MTNTEKFLELLGYKGGTIHQVSKVTGLTLDQILNLHTIPYTSYKTTSQITGSVMFTCSGIYIRETMSPEYRGDTDFWKAAIDSLKLKPFM
ncbi:hypothetical protein NVP1101O_199 [Vibrio phage 1.101.O._10N.261.45.C6]|nr:hypothetical protein NVP1101O_199 [Vibrio phage 1.101.O._10N.261.45.C6]